MFWRRVFFNPFITGPLTGWLMGNYSLGLITAGLTVLVWGFEPGMNFVVITTIILVALTGNINLEIIFLYSLSLAFIIRESKICSDNRNLFYVIAASVSILLSRYWEYILGCIQVSFLNELNIAGELLLLAGLVLTLYRGRNYEFPESFLILIVSVLGISGELLLIPVWLLGIVILKHGAVNPHVQRIGSLILLGGILSAAGLLLPLNIFFTAPIILCAFFLIFRRQWKIPLLETVYLSIILGILAGRTGLIN
jgi:hypothetical protein